MFTDSLQFMANQRAAIIGSYCNQLDLAVSEIKNLERSRQLYQFSDVVGNHLFRADKHIYRGRFMLKQLATFKVLGGTNPRNFIRGVKESCCNLTGNNIYLVTVGYSKNHLGIFSSSLSKYLGVGRMPGNCTNIKPVL